MASGKHNAKVRARGLDGTGVTEDVARAMHSAVGSGKAWIAIVEVQPVRQINEGTGDHAVECTLGYVEIAEPGSRAESVLGEVARGLYRDRRAAEGEIPETSAAGERSTDDSVSGAEALLERGPDGKTEGIWDGSEDDDPDRTEDLAGDPTPAATEEEQHEPQLAGPGAADPAYETHAFLPGTNDPTLCAVEGCGQPLEAPVHIVSPDA